MKIIITESQYNLLIENYTVRIFNERAMTGYYGNERRNSDFALKSISWLDICEIPLMFLYINRVKWLAVVYDAAIYARHVSL